MKESMMSITLMIMLLFLVSCGDSNDKNPFELDNTESSPAAFSLGKENIQLPQTLLAKDFCKLIEEGGNPFLLEKYLAENMSLQRVQTYFDYFKKNGYTCFEGHEVLNHYPAQIYRYPTQNNKDLLLAVRLNSENQVRVLGVKLIDNDIEITQEMIPGEGGTKLATFVFRKKEEKVTRPLLLIRTPYFHSGISTHINNAFHFLKEGFNVAVGENRGVHLSEGDFEWLTNKNIIDGKNTVEYLAKTPFSNGKILNFGISYDGFNALTGSIANPKGLVATIACSSPINAKLDSLSANRVIGGSLLNYVWERETGDRISNISNKLEYLEKLKIPFEEYDNYLFKRDVKEWNDILSIIQEEETDEYWRTRDMTKRLKEIRVPIFHIAGFDNDQDSRDVLLAWEHVKDEPNHHLYLHSMGHGCGLFFKTDYYKNLKEYVFKGDEVEITAPKVIQEKLNRREMKDSKFPPSGIVYKKLILPKKRLTEPEIKLVKANNLDVEDVIATLADSLYENKKENKVEFEIPVNQEMIVGGMIELNLKIFIKSKWTLLGMSISRKRPDDSSELLHVVAHPQWTRSSLHFTDEEWSTFYQGKIELPPVQHKFLSGDKLVLTLATSAKVWLINFFKEDRRRYFEQNGEGTIFILGNKDQSTHLKIPVEGD